jgi:hypothetical protein
VKAPYSGVIMQSNAIMYVFSSLSRIPTSTKCYLQTNDFIPHRNDPKTPAELHEQYTEFMKALNLDPSDPSSLETLKDASKVPWQKITEACERLTPWGTFRSCSDGSFLSPSSPGSMAYQSSPAFASALREKGIKYLVVGDLKEEWYLYAIAHPIENYEDVRENLRRYYPDQIVGRFLEYYRVRARLGEDSGREECFRIFGDMASQGQGILNLSLTTSEHYSTSQQFTYR